MELDRTPTASRISSKIDDLETKHRDVEGQMWGLNERLKKQRDLDMSVWTDVENAHKAKIKINRLERNISMFYQNIDDEYEESLERWAPDAKRFLEKDVVLERELKLLEREKNKYIRDSETPGPRFQNRQSWTQLFISSRLGFGVTKQSHTRLKNRQQYFRAELVDVMNSKDPDPSTPAYRWCPVTKVFCRDNVAGHLFPHKSGDELMEVIFGKAEQDRWIGHTEAGKSELFRACNGILWSQPVEIMFTKGYFTIVPDLNERPTPAQCAAWQDSDPKEYRIQILRPEMPEMQWRIDKASPKRWVDLDNERLEWRSDFRPRARYLYWSYCEQMLRSSYNSAAEGRSQEVGKKRYWGTAGSYMRKNMLLGFVEKMGHDYEYLMEGAMEMDMGANDVDFGGGEESSPIGAVLANMNILDKVEKAKDMDLGLDRDVSSEEDSEMED